MAGALGRISSIFKAKMNATLDAVENPNEMIGGEPREQGDFVECNVLDIMAFQVFANQSYDRTFSPNHPFR